MKKTLYYAFLLALLLSLTACGSKTNATTGTDDSTPPGADTTAEPADNGEEPPAPVSVAISPSSYTAPAIQPPRTTSDDMTPESIADLYRGEHRARYVYSTDGTTYAYTEWGGNIGYAYNPEDATARPAPAPWWETQELPEWMTLNVADAEWKENLQYATTNFYPDLPEGRLDAISVDDPVYSYRYKNGTYIVYSDITYLYKDGVEQNHWNTQSYDGCFVAPFCNWIFDGKGQISEMCEDGSTKPVMDHISTAYYNSEPLVEALRVKDGALSVHYIDPYGDNANRTESANLTSSGVLKAEFGCYTILYVGTDGKTYGLYSMSYIDEDSNVRESDSYYTLFHHDCTPTFICLGDQSIDYYRDAYQNNYRQRDDVSEWSRYGTMGGVQHFFDLCAAGEY